MSKINIEIKKEAFGDFLSKLESLSKISDTLKIKIDSNDVLIYSLVGESVVLAFKTFLIKTEDLFFIKKDIDNILNIVITNAKKCIKNLSFIRPTENVLLNIDCIEGKDGSLCARSLNIKNGKFKIGIQGGEEYEIRDITKEKLSKTTDIINKKWNFQIKNEDFSMVKELSRNNSEGKIIHLSVDSNTVILSETSIWELSVDNTELSDRTLCFSKNFLSSINDKKDIIDFYIFETFLLIKDDDSNLMISFEQTFDD